MDRALCPVLVGRERELSLLEDALLAAHRGGGQVVVIGGEAGVGKTRLAMELQERARRVGTAVMVGTTSEADVALPYLPFIEAIGNYLAGADLDRIKLQLGAATCRQLGQLLPQFELQTTLIVPGEPTQAKIRLYEAILAFLRLAAERTGLLLLLEDLHWADPSTRELLEYIARRLRRRSRILLLATYRNDELNRRHPLRPLIQGWQRTGIAQIVDLQPLPPGGVARMVSAIFDNAPVEADLRDFLHERTEGNPFVLEELLKAALDQGDIFLTAGGWDRKAIHQLRLPPTVKQAILLRVERMTDEQADITLRSEEHTSELQSLAYIVCRLLLEKNKRPLGFDAETSVTCHREAIFQMLRQPSVSSFHKLLLGAQAESFIVFRVQPTRQCENRHSA